MFIMDNTFTQSELKWYVKKLVKKHWFFLGDNPDDEIEDKTRSLGITKDGHEDFDELDYFLIERLNKVLSYNFDQTKMRIIKNCFPRDSKKIVRQQGNGKRTKAENILQLVLVVQSQVVDCFVKVSLEREW